jgi:hypothetical protein
MPDLMKLPPTGDGIARVVIATDTRARVDRVSRVHFRNFSKREPAYSTELLCETTPCAVTLPYGDHELEFLGVDDPDRKSTATLGVHEGTVVLNHTLGRERTHPWRIASWVLLGSGAALLVSGGAIAVASGDKRSNETLDTYSALFASGLGALAVGGVVLFLTPTLEQPGSSTEWSPHPDRRAVGATVIGAF